MGGYYCIVKTIKQEYYLNFRGKGLGEAESVLKRKVMQAFPYMLPMIEYFDDWIKIFINKNRNVSFYKGKYEQGTVFAKCVIRNGLLIDILQNSKYIININNNENITKHF